MVLYHTLVQDGALPSGYESDFAELGPYIFPEADRQLRQLAGLDNVSASVVLNHLEKERTQIGCRHMELKYEIGYAVLNRVMSLLKLNGTIIFPVPVTSFWTPHSGRSFLPERDYLGGWSPQGSDRYARIDGLRISNLQRAVARTIRQGPQSDSLGERETLEEPEDFMLQKNVATETLCAISSAISSWDPVPDFSVPSSLEVEFVPELTPIIQQGRRREVAKPLFGQNSWEKIPRSPGLASVRTFLKASIFPYRASAQSVRSIDLAHVMQFLILTIRVGPIPVLICPSSQSMTWYVHYAHVKGLPPQHCRVAQSVPPQLRMKHAALDNNEQGSLHFSQSPEPSISKRVLSLTFPCGLWRLQTKARVNSKVAKGLSWNSLLPHTCNCGFSPFFTRPL